MSLERNKIGMDAQEQLDLPHLKDSWKGVKYYLGIMGDSKNDFKSFLLHWNKLSNITKCDPKLGEKQFEFMKSHQLVNIFIANTALSSEILFPNNVPVLSPSGKSYEKTFTREELASLNALMFFGLFPFQKERKNFPLFRTFQEFWNKPYGLEHLKCIYNYFELYMKRVEKDPSYSNRKVIYKRNTLNQPFQPEELFKKSKPLTELSFNLKDPIEGMEKYLQVDFANKFIGGGVTRCCNCQEEIRFLVCPDMMPSLLIFEQMAPNDAIFIIGAEQYSAYSGYMNTFLCKGPFEDKTEVIERTNLVALVAIDAENYSSNELFQFEKPSLDRELLKAYVGFKFEYEGQTKKEVGDKTSLEKIKETYDPELTVTEYTVQREPKLAEIFKKMPIATGKWGCGVFKGNFELKILIQLLAASLAERDITFCLFQDEKSLKFLEENLIDIKKLDTEKLYGFLTGMVKNFERDKLKHVQQGEIFFRLRALLDSLK